MCCLGPDLNWHGREGRGILSFLHLSATQDNPLKQQSNALPSCVKLLLDAVILTYEYQQSISEIPPRGGNFHCDCDGYCRDTLGGGIGIASSPNLYYLEALLRGAPLQFQIVYRTINIHVSNRYLIVCGSKNATGKVNCVIANDKV